MRYASAAGAAVRHDLRERRAREGVRDRSADDGRVRLLLRRGGEVHERAAAARVEVRARRLHALRARRDDAEQAALRVLAGVARLDLDELARCGARHEDDGAAGEPRHACAAGGDALDADRLTARGAGPRGAVGPCGVAASRGRVRTSVERGSARRLRHFLGEAVAVALGAAAGAVMAGTSTPPVACDSGADLEEDERQDAEHAERGERDDGDEDARVATLALLLLLLGQPERAGSGRGSESAVSICDCGAPGSGAIGRFIGTPPTMPAGVSAGSPGGCPKVGAGPPP